MAKFYDSLTESQREFIARQKIFFTATAPTEGRINLSPKGMDSFRVLADNTVAYLDLTGSGNETAAHILENQRMTIMMCSFDKEPLILRLYGKGEVITPDMFEWKDYLSHFTEYPGTRQIIKLNIESTQTSCGYSIPFYEYTGERDKLIKWSEKKGDEGLAQYRLANNQTSIDGLPISVEDTE